jgi:hypothetical protein
MSEQLMQRLAELPAADPDPERAEQIKRRCRAQLSRQARRASAAPTLTPRRKIAAAWQPLLAVLGVAYLTVAIFIALGLHDLP